MEKRQIIDKIILVQEAIHSSREWGDQGMIVKIDMANGFDRVRHSFLIEVMKKFGFSLGFMDWISSCITSQWIVPMVNGCPTSFFKSTRGMSQGFPLSPLLYIIVAETMRRQIKKDQIAKIIPKIKIARGVK
jgi:hypothetical protein